MLIQEKYYDILNNKKVLAAVSGGVDSMCLLYDLVKLRHILNIDVEVAHFDHLTRDGESTKDKEFVETFCKNHNLIFHSKAYSMYEYRDNNDVSIEEAGRILRMNLFESVISDNPNYILLFAHNLDDNVETVFMRIIRGTGLTGLEGIKEYEKKKNYEILRPLIEVSKEEILDYASKNNIEYRQDHTNFENIYTRNKIRNELIPLIKREYNSNIYQAISKLSNFSILNNRFVESEIDNIVNLISRKENNLVIMDSKKLNNYNDFEKTLIIRNTLDRVHNNYNFTNSHYEEILKIIKSEKGVDLTINDIVFYNSFNNFIIRKIMKNDLEKDIIIKKDGKIKLNDYLINIKKTNKEILIRQRKNGDRIKLKNSTKKVKDFLIDKKIDKYERDYIPIIEIDNEIKFIGNIYKSNLENTEIIIERIANE